MRRRQRRVLAIAAGTLLAVLVASVPLLHQGRQRTRISLLAEIGEPLTRPPRVTRPGSEARPCRSGQRMAVALAGSEPLLGAEQDLVDDFLADPQPGSAEAVREVIEVRTEALHALLDAADCREHGPVPRQPGDLLDLLDMGHLAVAHAWLLALHGDAEGSMRWALDTWALSQQFGEGRLIELVAGQALGAGALTVADHLVATGELPPIHLVPALEVMVHLLEHRPDLAFAVLQDARERSREVALDPGARLLLERAGVREHLDHARRAYRALQLPYPEHRPLIVDLDSEEPRHPTAAVLRPRLVDPVDADTLAHAREAALVLLAGLRVWRDVRGSCPPTLEELEPDFLGTLPLDPISAAPFRYDPVSCEVRSGATPAGRHVSSSLMEPGGER